MADPTDRETPAGGRPAHPSDAQVPEHPKPAEAENPADIDVQDGSLATRDPAEGKD
jgi:hypothetical protein